MTNTVCPHYTYPLSLLLHSIGGVPPFFFIAIAVTPLAELHADLFSRYASPLDFCVFVAVDKRGEGVTSDEICRRCNGKQQRRRRDSRSVQLPDWFMIINSTRHIRTYYVRPNLFGEKIEDNPPPRRSGLGMDV